MGRAVECRERLWRAGVVCLATGLSMLAGNVIGNHEGRWEARAKGPPALGGEVLSDVLGGEHWGLLMDRAALRHEVRMLKDVLTAESGSPDLSEAVSVVGRLEARQAWLEGALGALKAEVRGLRRRLATTGEE